MLLAMAAVLSVTLLCGSIARRLGQARVVGEIVGGVLLGPSMLGRLAPATAAHLFPASVLSSFDVLSTFGLVLYLFLIGTRMELTHLRAQGRTTLLASGASILLPLALSLLLVHPLRHHFSSAGTNPLAFVLFLGVSLSITAFPVLARILEERGLTATPLGTTALLSAAVDDVCAWILLSVAMTLISQSRHEVAPATRLAFLGVYLATMLLAVRPLARSIARRWSGLELSLEALGCVVAVLLASADVTDAIGVHPLFGAFLAGLCFPRVPAWQLALRQKLEPLATILLPFFFALTGMRTRIDLLRGASVWVWTGAIITVAVAGKMGGAILAGRISGETWRNALALGALLNTRGLVELVVLNIALGAGVFSPTLFSMLVVMALATTAMTLPLLRIFRVGNDAPMRFG
jgi:Kef-type K+ transport system membrane component KefB